MSETRSKCTDPGLGSPWRPQLPRHAGVGSSWGNCLAVRGPSRRARHHGRSRPAPFGCSPLGLATRRLETIGRHHRSRPARPWARPPAGLGLATRRPAPSRFTAIAPIPVPTTPRSRTLPIRASPTRCRRGTCATCTGVARRSRSSRARPGRRSRRSSSVWGRDIRRGRHRATTRDRDRDRAGAAREDAAHEQPVEAVTIDDAHAHLAGVGDDQVIGAALLKARNLGLSEAACDLQVAPEPSWRTRERGSSPAQSLTASTAATVRRRRADQCEYCSGFARKTAPLVRGSGGPLATSAPSRTLTAESRIWRRLGSN
jgi:hypothetical protein